jgi:hypothetical protein
MKHNSRAITTRKTACLSLAIALLLLLPFAQVACSQQLEVKLVSLTSPVSPGNPATITVSTTPGANCLITVFYMSGPSKAQGLFPQSADTQGQVSWTWLVGSNTTPGNWPIHITCTAQDQKRTLEASLIVL